MAKDITAAKERAVDRLKSSLERARVLHSRAVVAGRWTNPQNVVVPFSNPDKRDLTEFIFFESAAAFEHFCQQTFVLAARSRFSVQPRFWEHIVGHGDSGLDRVMGWGAPQNLVFRARALFGKRHFFARLRDNLPQDVYEWLTYAHRVRNRIAHPGGQAAAQTNKLLGNLGVPAASRKGISMGRLLLEYPVNAAANNRWFYRFIQAYEETANLVYRRIRA
jgi:hypothetical protein